MIGSTPRPARTQTRQHASKALGGIGAILIVCTPTVQRAAATSTALVEYPAPSLNKHAPKRSSCTNKQKLQTPRSRYRRTSTNLGRERQDRVAGSSVVHPELEDAVRVRHSESLLEEPLRPRLQSDTLVRVQHHELHLRVKLRKKNVEIVRHHRHHMTSTSLISTRI